MTRSDPYNLSAGDTEAPAGTDRYFADGEVLLPWAFDPASLRNPGTKLLEIPLGSVPGTVSLNLPGRSVRLRLTFEDGEGTWIMDIYDDGEAPLVCGIPLLIGLDLLGPYGHLGFNTRMFVLRRGGDPAEDIGYDDLGTAAGLFFEVAA